MKWYDVSKCCTLLYDVFTKMYVVVRCFTVFPAVSVNEVRCDDFFCWQIDNLPSANMKIFRFVGTYAELVRAGL